MAPVLVAIALDFDVPLTKVVGAAGTYFVAYGLMQPVWGVVSDRIGLVRTMRLTLAVAGLASMASALVTGPSTLVLARGIAGGLFAAAYPACLIYLGDTVPSARRQEQIARLMVGIALGTAVASIGAGVLATLVSWRAAFVVTGALALVVSATTGMLPSPPPHGRAPGALASFARVARSRSTTVVLLLAFVEGAVLLGTLTLVPPSIESTGASSAVADLVAGAYGAAVLLTSRAVSRVTGRLPAAALVATGASSALVACLLLAFDQRPAPGVAAAALLGLAWTAMHSTLQTWATEVLPGDRATVVSLFAGSLFCGSALAAFAVSGLADAGRWTVVFALAATLSVGLGVAGTSARARWRPTPASHT